MKPMTFEEWWDSDEYGEGWTALSREQRYRRVFEDARKGMIPEDEAVRIPPVEEWPVGAESIRVEYYDDWGHDKWETISTIPRPRPVPAWTPKVGEAVFGKVDEHRVIVGMVSEIPELGRWIGVTQGSSFAPFYRGNLKPFSPEKIGLKWEEI